MKRARLRSISVTMAPGTMPMSIMPMNRMTLLLTACQPCQPICKILPSMRMAITIMADFWDF